MNIGTKYEDYIISCLKHFGYKTFGTKASHDQGCDIVLDINPQLRIIFQCKYYSSRLSNKAIQEIAAAKEYYNAQVCVVITNSSFTYDATLLAKANNILLIDKFDFNTSPYWLIKQLGLVPDRFLDEIELKLNDLIEENKILKASIV